MNTWIAILVRTVFLPGYGKRVNCRRLMRDQTLEYRIATFEKVAKFFALIGNNTIGANSVKEGFRGEVLDVLLDPIIRRKQGGAVAACYIGRRLRSLVAVELLVRETSLNPILIFSRRGLWRGYS
ncbi:hypothetical protein A3SK_0104170 [Pseudomonas amygdali pv. tabaci str. 6605]|nr:hypothetical protein A3SK_0104170 [Pseudomonas amygdali pv. tabaci str. 6605]